MINELNKNLTSVFFQSNNKTIIALVLLVTVSNCLQSYKH